MQTVSSTVEVSVDTSLLLDIEDRQEQDHEAFANADRVRLSG